MRQIQTQILQEAKVFGAAACLARAERTPAKDQLLLVLLEHVDIEQSEPVLRAWLEGWDYANQRKN